MRIAHVAAEVSPFAKTGGLGDVVGALPVAHSEMGHDVSVWMPFYRQVRTWLTQRGQQPEWVTDPVQVDVGFQRYECGLLRTRLPGSHVPVYLVAHDPFFDRPALYSPDSAGRDDGALRYSVFVRAVLEAMRRLQLVPDILQAHDWHTALAPMALAWDSPRDWHFGHTRSVLTIHNAAYQGIYPPGEFVNLGLPPEVRAEWGVLDRGILNLLKGGLMAAGAITAVSPSFARELTSHEGGFGLDGVFRSRSWDLVGIVNGIDTKVWNPKVDPRLPAHYERDDLEGKAKCRRELLRFAGMDPDDPGFVIGIVGRLTDQKGYDLLFPVLDDLLLDGTRFVFLGSGDPHLEAAVRAFSHRAGRFFGYIGFSEDVAHLIEAGADAFLMPSRFEPCGLNQLYSLAYGTPPVVRRVGGLRDTVVGYDGLNVEHATGFAFDDPHPDALRDTVRWAHHVFHDQRAWNRIVRNGMAQDFSWHRSAEHYLKVYERLLR